jgi:hypothetical protein
VKIYDGTLSKEKEYFVKIYDSNGNFQTSAYDISFDNFKKTINGGLGELSLFFARPFDDFGEGVEIDFMNEVQVWVVDKESGPTGEKIYSGFIDTYEPFATEENEGVNVNCLGYVSRFGDILYKDGTTISIAQASVLPSAIVSDIVTKYRTVETEALTGSVDNNTSTVTYTFNMKTCYEALEIARSLAPAGWYWYVDEENILYFKNKPTSATHIFTFKKDLKSIRVMKNIRDVCNRLILWNGEQVEDATFICRQYLDATSGLTYGKRYQTVTDGRIKDTTTADIYGNAYLDARKDPNIRVELEIVDSSLNQYGYNLESINPGDTCSVRNLPDRSTTFDDNMTITEVRYKLGTAVVTLEDMRQKVSNKISDVIMDLGDHVSTDGPATYTSV